jgi:DNA polymerase I
MAESWIFDVTGGTGVDLWSREGDRVRHSREECPPSFYLSLSDPHAHWEMLAELEDRYGAAGCRFETIYGPVNGYRVPADRKVAEAIERQTRGQVSLYNVDVRTEQQYFARRGLFPCAREGESRFSPDIDAPLTVTEIRVPGMPYRNPSFTGTIVDGKTLSGSEQTVLADLFSLVAATDPDVILFPHADAWMQVIEEKARGYGLEMPFSRSGRYRRLGSRSYWSYGRREFREAAVIPEGRILIDTEESFVYREGGLAGVCMAARLTGLSPNLTSRFTPGTLVSAYEIYEAVRRGIAVPFRKSDPERVRRCSSLRAADRGGMMFQPEPRLYGRTAQLDFTSLYPSIIVRYNLSPETIRMPKRRGFLAEALAPLLDLRISTKSLKKGDPAYAGIDSVLKWMLVTCFGYTGYKNAKFGSIEMHERITGISREILLSVKATAEEMGFSVLHGIVDCLWVQGEGVRALQERIERETGLLLEREDYTWLVFLPQADGSGAYNRYFGRLSDGTVKVRGIAARRRDAPPYIVAMQRDLLAVMGEAETPAELPLCEERVRAVYRRYHDGLSGADPADLVIRRRISRTDYSRACIEAAAVRAFRDHGVSPAPGMEIAYVVRDASRLLVDPEWDAGFADLHYYRSLVGKAWEEIEFAFRLRDPGTSQRR